MSVEIKRDIKHRFKSRVEYIDIAKVLCILLVLMGHLLMDDNPFKSMIYSFHMPLFFIVSGIVMKGNSFKTIVAKRFYSILFPYIIWSLMFSGFSLKKIILIAASSNGMLWFLSVMFVASILGNSIIKFIKQKYYFFSVVSIISLLLSIILNLFHNKIVMKGFSLGLP